MIQETFISVDVEASGPIPGEFSMLSLGACVVGATSVPFYVEIKPITRDHDPDALRISGFDLDDLERRGVEPPQAMAAFESWTRTVTPHGHRPVLVAYPIAFDWMFVAYYFHRFLGRNPFGVAGLDLTSFYAGKVDGPPPLPALPALSERQRVEGSDSRHVGVEGWTVGELEQRLAAQLPLTHNALADATAQARVFEQLLTHRRPGQAS